MPEAATKDEISLENSLVNRVWPWINPIPASLSPGYRKHKMAQNHQVRCINKTDRTDAHDRIKSIGGVNADGTLWKIGQPEAIKGIEAGQWNFYVSGPGNTVWLIVAESRFGHKYLKTQSDGEQPNNLLSLPECP